MSDNLKKIEEKLGELEYTPGVPLIPVLLELVREVKKVRDEVDRMKRGQGNFTGRVEGGA